MNAPARAASASSLHPALWVAAVSVTAFSAVGIAKMSGLFEPATPAPVVAAAAQTGTTPAPAIQAVAAAEPAQPVAAAADKPTDKRSEKPVVKAVAAKKVHVADAGEAGVVKVADRTYDSGIDVIPAQPRTTYEQTLPRSGGARQKRREVGAEVGARNDERADDQKRQPKQHRATRREGANLGGGRLVLVALHLHHCLAASRNRMTE